MQPTPRHPGPSLFEGLSEHDRARLTAEFEQVTLARGDALMREGDPADHLFVVVSGDRKSTRLNSSHGGISRMPSSA